MRDSSLPARRAIARTRAFVAAVAVALLPLLLPSHPVGAQAREHQRHDFESAEGKILGFYSAALAFTGGGPALESPPGMVAFALEAAYVPYLTREQRTASSDKPQSSNLAPAFPRPRLVFSLPWRVRAEASWIPPLRLFDAQANLVSVAVSRPVGELAQVTVVPRLAFMAGRIEGAITCNDDLREGSQDQQVYYTTVCRGRESEDYFDPLHVSAELLANRAMMSGRLIPYVSAGVLYERVQFDIGVLRDDGSRDPDHPVLEMRATRPFALIGAQWRPYERFATGTEIYIAPGSLVTARLLATVQLRGR